MTDFCCSQCAKKKWKQAKAEYEIAWAYWNMLLKEWEMKEAKCEYKQILAEEDNKEIQEDAAQD
jgi:hypothetical protein